MNALPHLTFAVMTVAIAAAAFSLVASPAHAADKPVPLVVLPAVQVTAQRATLVRVPPVVVLPRVTVIGKREPAAQPTRLARQDASTAERF